MDSSDLIISLPFVSVCAKPSFGLPGALATPSWPKSSSEPVILYSIAYSAKIANSTGWQHGEYDEDPDGEGRKI